MAGAPPARPAGVPMKDRVQVAWTGRPSGWPVRADRPLGTSSANTGACQRLTASARLCQGWPKGRAKPMPNRPSMTTSGAELGRAGSSTPPAARQRA